MNDAVKIYIILPPDTGIAQVIETLRKGFEVDYSRIENEGYIIKLFLKA